jgi:putative exporter of polyketide antibiotics
MKHDKQDHQGKAAFNERNPNTTQQQEPVAMSPGGPQTTGKISMKANQASVFNTIYQCIKIIIIIIIIIIKHTQHHEQNGQ